MTETLQKPREKIRVKIRNLTDYFNNIGILMGIAKRHGVGEEAIVIRQAEKEGVAYLYLPVNEQSDSLVEDYHRLKYVTSVEKGSGLF